MKNRIIFLGIFLAAVLVFTTYNSTAKASSEKDFPVKEIVTPELTAEEKIEKLYESFLSVNESMPSKTAFANAMKGYKKLQAEKKVTKEILTVVDFGLASTEKRMWILDMSSRKLLFHTYVSHGQNSGGNMATKFSNTPSSHQSSLGFFITGETYYGKNGLSLFIDGQEKRFNSKARQRYVVIHGADYAKPSAIKRLGRLGRSWGCPAVPSGVAKELINTIKGESVFFIYHPSKRYVEQSTYLNPELV